MQSKPISMTRLRTFVASLLSVALIAPFAAGCGNNGGSGGSAAGGSSSAEQRSAPQDYGTVPAPQAAAQPQHKGLTTGQKVAILAGTAALIYLYNKHKNAQAKQGAEGQYYRSKNGRIYYRDAQGNAHWVTPPAGGIQVPQDEAERYQKAAQTGQWDVDNSAPVSDSNGEPAASGAPAMGGGGAPPGPGGR